MGEIMDTSMKMKLLKVHCEDEVMRSSLWRWSYEKLSKGEINKGSSIKMKLWEVQWRWNDEKLSEEEVMGS